MPRGGARRGAGRPKPLEPKVTLRAWIRREHRQYLEMARTVLMHDYISETVRHILDKARSGRWRVEKTKAPPSPLRGDYVQLRGHITESQAQFLASFGVGVSAAVRSILDTAKKRGLGLPKK